jgi:IS5 family transposase
MRLKAHKKYEFGVKVSLAVTQRDNFIVGALALPGNPFDGHTLPAALRQVERLTGTQPERCFVDRGYRGHGIKDTSVYISPAKDALSPGHYAGRFSAATPLNPSSDTANTMA